MTTLPALFAAQVARTPSAPAVVADGASVSYVELDRRANRLAHHLIAEGVGPESVVGVCLDRGVELVVALLGIHKAGGAYLPLDPDYPAERVDYMRSDSGATTVVTAATFARVDGPSDDPGTEVLPAHPAYVIYTSGSTGRPKGVVIEHRGIVNRLVWMQDEYALDGTDRVLQKTPYSFDVSVWEFFWPLITGATPRDGPPGGHRDPRYLAEIIDTERITTVHFVPSMLRTFLAEPLRRAAVVAAHDLQRRGTHRRPRRPVCTSGSAASCTTCTARPRRPSTSRRSAARPRRTRRRSAARSPTPRPTSSTAT